MCVSASNGWSCCSQDVGSRGHVGGFVGLHARSRGYHSCYPTLLELRVGSAIVKFGFTRPRSRRRCAVFNGECSAAALGPPEVCLLPPQLSRASSSQQTGARSPCQTVIPIFPKLPSSKAPQSSRSLFIPSRLGTESFSKADCRLSGHVVLTMPAPARRKQQTPPSLPPPQHSFHGEELAESFCWCENVEY